MANGYGALQFSSPSKKFQMQFNLISISSKLEQKVNFWKSNKNTID